MVVHISYIFVGFNFVYIWGMNHDKYEGLPQFILCFTVTRNESENSEMSNKKGRSPFYVFM